MNIAVCDDQPEVLDVVENMLREIPEVKRVETYQDIRRMRDEFEDGKRPDAVRGRRLATASYSIARRHFYAMILRNRSLKCYTNVVTVVANKI